MRSLASIVLLLVALAGCSDPSGTTPQDDIPVDAGERVLTTEFHMNAGTAIGSDNPVTGPSATGQGVAVPFEVEDPENLTSLIVTVTWQPSTPASSTLRASIHRGGGTRIIASAEGPSPLEIQLPTPFDDPGLYIDVLPVAGQATYEQGVDVHVAAAYRA